MVVPYENIVMGNGHGWLEWWYVGDDEDMECKVLTECMWINGGVFTVDHVAIGAEYLKRWYNRKGGMRVWAIKPTEQEQGAVQWGA